MHVLLFAPGTAIHTIRLVHALLASEHRVTLVSTENVLEEGAQGYHFIRYPGIRGFHRLSSHITARLEMPIRAAQMRKIWRQVKPDVVNVQGIDWRAAFCAAAGLRPLVLTAWGADINDLFDTDFGDEGYRQRLESLLGARYHIRDDKRSALAGYRRDLGAALARADLVTAVTPQILRRCDSLAGKKVPPYLFRYGVDFDRFRPGYSTEALALRQQLRIPEGAKVLLSVRTLQPLFGHVQILEAYAQIAEDPEVPPAVLVFQEKYTFERELESLKARVAELDLTERVFWLPSYIPEEDLPVQYAFADVIVNYPTHDGFPVSLLEAAACRRPVISSDLEAYEGTYGDSLVMVPLMNVPALAHAMRQVLTESQSQQDERVERAYRIAREIGDQHKNFLGLFQRFESLRS